MNEWHKERRKFGFVRESGDRQEIKIETNTESERKREIERE
jgi:hypothetical protein